MSGKKWIIPCIVLATLALLAIVPPLAGAGEAKPATQESNAPDVLQRDFGADAASGAPAATHTVNSTGDGSDANPGDGVCETATGNGICTLRAAIEETNALDGPDTIEFDAIGLIMPDNPLPYINDPDDGTTIKGYPTWILGSNAGVDAHGFHLESDGNKLQNLVISNFSASGVQVDGNNNIVGTDGDGIDDDEERNIIASNGKYGVHIRYGANGNWLAGNWIGLSLDGTSDAGNLEHGVFIAWGSHTNLIGTNGDGTSDELEGNVISGNDQYGIDIFDVGTDQNIIAGNYIGTNATGDAAIPNAYSGISISNGSANNRIGTDGDGTSDELEGNLISGNGDHGITLSDAPNNVIAGNHIGTNVSGTAAISNTNSGMQIDASSDNNRIGTDGDGIADELEGNVISGNGDYGIFLRSSSNNIVAGNHIGTNAAGTAAISNARYGVSINISSTHNLIGTDADGTSDDLERNVISGNENSGIYFSRQGTDSNVIAGNYIGTNAAGDTAIPNGNDGIEVWSEGSNRIGGTLIAERNIVSGNDDNGIFLNPVTTATLLVQGNYIGTDASGSGALGNGSYGVNLYGAAAGNTIGGAASGAANRIAFNGAAGIRVSEFTSTNRLSYDNSLRGNAIFSNTGLGIDLWPEGVTPNDPGDGDDGPNHLQNYPMLTLAESDGSQIVIEGALNSSANTTFELDFYANSSCDPSGYGEGEIYLGPDIVTTDGSGNASFETTLPGSIPPGYFATATATDPGGNTSEFSECRVVTAICSPVHDPDFSWNPIMPLIDQMTTFTGTATGTPPISFTWDFGDSNTGSGAVVQHSYSAAGDYTVLMSATNCTGTVVVTQTHVVTVQDLPCDPVHDADFDWTPTTPAVNQVVTFTGGATGTLPIAFTWDLGDGNEGTGQTLSHSYAAAGAYAVILTATNCTDASVTATHTITIAEAPECIEVSGVTLTQITTGTVYAGDTVDFSADIAPDGFDGPYTYTVLLGGGEIITPTSSSDDPLTFDYTFPNTGTYQVEVRVWNCDMSQADAVTDSLELTVYESGVCVPLETITILGESTGYAGVAYTFDTGYTPAGASLPISYTWDDSGTGANSTRTFDVTGTHTLSVTAANCDGTPVEDEHVIVIEEVPPCVELSSVDLTWVDGTLYLGDVAHFSADLVPDEAAKPYSYTIDYGDGGASVDGSSSDDPFSFNYTYAATGTYTVTFWAWNCDMTESTSDTAQVVVIEPVPESYTIYLPIVIRQG